MKCLTRSLGDLVIKKVVTANVPVVDAPCLECFRRRECQRSYCEPFLTSRAEAMGNYNRWRTEGLKVHEAIERSRRKYA